jgi:hypothetical protein
VVFPSDHGLGSLKDSNADDTIHVLNLTFETSNNMMLCMSLCFRLVLVNECLRSSTDEVDLRLKTQVAMKMDFRLAFASHISPFQGEIFLTALSFLLCLVG